MVTVILLILIYFFVGIWKLYVKLGAKGWASLVPVYNEYVLVKNIGLNPWWLVINCTLPIFQPFLAVYYYILKSVSLSKMFNTTNYFLAGLILLPGIFMPLLGWADFKASKPNPMEDKVFKFIEKI